MQKLATFLLKGVLTLVFIFMLGYLGLILYVNFQKSTIIQDISNKMAEEVNGNVVIEDIELSFFKNFPHTSVLLKNVEIQDQFFARHKHLFLQSDLLFLELDPIMLFKREFSIKGLKIENAHFYIFTDSTGYTNSYLFKARQKIKDKDTTLPRSFSKTGLERLVLKNVEVTYDDEATHKLFELEVQKMVVGIDDTDSSLLLSVHTNLLIRQILFKTSNTTLLKNNKAKGDFDLLYNKSMMKIYSDSMDLIIGGQPFNLNLLIDLSGSAPKFHLKVNKGSIPFASLKSILPNRNKRNT